MANIKDEIYFCVQAWMVTKLKLHTVERDVYAIIYGYSQDEESDFHGSLSYLSELTGYSKNSICEALKSLKNKKLITKEEQIVNNVKVCRYRTSNLDSIQGTCMGIQGTCMGIQGTCMGGVQGACTNNNSNIKKDNKNINNNFEFGKRPKEKSSNLYSNCIAYINTYTDNEEVRSYLKDFLHHLCEIQKLKGLVQFKGIVKNLNGFSSDKQIEMIKYSLQHGYPTLYELKEYKTNNVSSDMGRTVQRASKEVKEAIRNGKGNAEKF